MIVVNIKCSKCGKTIEDVLYTGDGNRRDLMESKCCGVPTILNYIPTGFRDGMIRIALEEEVC